MASDHVQRKLAAILAADVVGYSRLTGADEEGTASRLRALRAELIDPAIEVNRGRIVEDDGRWDFDRVRQRCRRRALCSRSPAWHGRAQRGHAD